MNFNQPNLCFVVRCLLAVAAWQMAAADRAVAAPPPIAKDLIPALSYGSFPLEKVRTHLSAEAGLPAAKAEMNSPFPNDFPPSLTLGLEDARLYPAFKKGARYFIPARNVVRIYQVTDVQKAPYQTIQPQLDALRRLLKVRPGDLSGDHPHTPEEIEAAKLIPDYPPRNAAQMIITNLQYLDADWGSGLFYITQFVQGMGESPNNEQLTYIFQGLSKDGTYYVSADFRITHPKLPAGIDTTPDRREDADAATRQIEKLLPRQPDDSFTPSLRKLRAWVGTLKFE